MDIACCVWALKGPEEEVLERVVGAGFRTVDLQSRTFASPGAREKFRSLGLRPSCLALSANMPAGAALEGPGEGAAQAALEHLRAGLEQARSLGISTAYVVPPVEPGDPDCFARSLLRAAEEAARRHIRLCVEHFPGRALPTAAGTLDYLRGLGHENLYLLLDIGHAQISGEDPVSLVDLAGERLGYVHLDDNDGRGDLHWALLDGVLSEEGLRTFLRALEKSPYTGPVSLELNPNLPDPLAALEKGRRLVETLRSP